MTGGVIALRGSKPRGGRPLLRFGAAAGLLAFCAPAGAQRLAYADLEATPPRLAYDSVSSDELSAPGPAVAARPGAAAVREYYLDQMEYVAARGADGYAWDLSAKIGGRRHRLYVGSIGEGTLGGNLDYLEMQALYSRSIGNWDLQAGLRWDLVPSPRRVYLTLGAQGYAIPEIFYLGGMLFLSHEGELGARLFGTYDIPIVSRLTLQPAFETEIAAQDVPELGIGAGPVYGEAGLRLRYRLGRGESDAFSPYVGVNYERLFGRTGRIAREEGEDVEGWSILAGIRSWF